MELLSNNIFFSLLALVFFYPIFLFNSAFIKVTIFIYAYPVWLLSGLWLGIPSTRIIERVGMPYYSEYIDTGFIWAMVSYIAFLAAISNLRKKEISFDVLIIPPLFRLFLLGIFILFLFLAYPSAMGVGTIRFGSFGSLVVSLLTLLIVTGKNRNKFDYLNLTLGFVLIFIILRGERVDFILGLLTLYLVFKGTSYISLKKMFLSFFVLLLLGTVGGAIRAGESLSVENILTVLWYSVVNFGTAIDVVHVYMSAVWYFHEEPLTLKPVINVIASFIPLSSIGGVSSEYNIVWILREKITNVGGGLFYSVGAMSFGLLGAALSGYIYGMFFKFLFSLKGFYVSFFLAFFIMQFRLQWYGATYFGKVFFVLFILGSVFYVIRKAGFLKDKV